MKNVKNYACASLFAVALLLTPGVVNAENANEVPYAGYETLLDEECKMKAKGETASGLRYRFKGTCEAVTKALKDLGEIK